MIDCDWLSNSFIREFEACRPGLISVIYHRNVKSGSSDQNRLKESKARRAVEWFRLMGCDIYVKHKLRQLTKF
jgi:hypothetical protein